MKTAKHIQLDEKTAVWIGEYASILRAARSEGWLAALLEAHFTPCDQQDAERLLAWIRIEDIEGGLPRGMDVRFKNKRGRARFNVRTRRYGISLPSIEGTGYAKLRAGIVLHEAAHVLDRQQSGTFGHKAKFRRILRRLVELNWRQHVYSGNQREIYDRHRGPYSLLLSRAVPGKGGKVEEQTDHVKGPFGAEEAHEEARMLVEDPRENVTSVHVFSITEGQFCGAFYKRGETYPAWGSLAQVVKEEPSGGMELSDQRDAPALLPGREEPVRQVDDPVDERVPTAAVSKPRPVRRVPAEVPAAAGAKRRGAILELDPGNAERWPGSKGASIVRAALEKGLRGTASELAKALAADLTAAGVEFPASLISRLKQGGFIREVQE